MARDGVTALLADPRYELLPFESMDGEVRHVPDGGTIAITASPQKGVDETVDRATALAGEGYELVPHVAARGVRDEAHLEEIAGRLLDAGITDLFVPGGDVEEPLGEFDSALALLERLADLGYEFEEVGVTGYPEGHPFLDEETLFDALERKQPHATYVVTQLCFDPEAVVAWVETVRRRGVDLPVEVGVPGVMKYQRLLDISQRVGVGDSVRFLRKTTGVLGFVRQLVGSRGSYTPDPVVDGLAPYSDDPEYDLRGVHLYTFNQVADVEEWRQERLG